MDDRLGTLDAPALMRLAEAVEVSAARAMAVAGGVAPEGGRLLRVEDVDGGIAVIGKSVPHPFFNRAVGQGLDGGLSAQTLRDLDRLLRQGGSPIALVQVPEPLLSPGVEAVAEELGWGRGIGWVKMVRGAEPAPEISTSLDIRVLGPEHGQRVAQITAEAFELPATVAGLGEAMVVIPRWHFYGAFDGDDLVGVGALTVSGSLGYLAVGATDRSHRRRGAQGALMAHRIREGLRMGAHMFVTETEQETPAHPNPSYHNMLRTGFRLGYKRADLIISIGDVPPAGS